MVTLEIRLSDTLHRRLRLVAERLGISINSLGITATAEKLSALETETLFKRARRGSSVAFLGVLAKVPSDPPLRGDELP